MAFDNLNSVILFCRQIFDIPKSNSTCDGENEIYISNFPYLFYSNFGYKKLVYSNRNKITPFSASCDEELGICWVNCQRKYTIWHNFGNSFWSDFQGSKTFAHFRNVFKDTGLRFFFLVASKWFNILVKVLGTCF